MEKEHKIASTFYCLPPVSPQEWAMLALLFFLPLYWVVGARTSHAWSLCLKKLDIQQFSPGHYHEVIFKYVWGHSGLSVWLGGSEAFSRSGARNTKHQHWVGQSHIVLIILTTVPMRSVQKVSSHAIWKIDIYWRRYKIQEVYKGQRCLSPLQSGHLGTSHSSSTHHQLPRCTFLNLIDGLKSLPFQR